MAMKKSIFFTLGAITLVGGIVATAVCVPAYIASQGNNPKLFNFNVQNLRLSSQTLSTVPVGFKEAVLGSKQINNGNYFIYIGSQAYGSNNQFLYGQSMNNGLDFRANRDPLLDGSFASGLKDITNLKVQPQVLVVQDVMTSQIYQDYLNYENQVNEWKKINVSDYQGKNNYQEMQKKYNWAQSAPKFNFAPGAQYTNWEGKQQTFRTDAYAKEFNELVNFVKTRFSNVKDISTSDGIIIGYKNGNICSNYSGSFNSNSTGSEGSGGGSDSNTPTTQNAFFKPFQNQTTTLATDAGGNNNNNNSTKTPFENWLESNYGLKNS